MAANPAYVDALRMVARRELSERQLRQRLARRNHASGDIDTAIDALKSQGSLDDARVAGMIARAAATGRKRGKLRVIRQIEAAGIAPALARRAADEVFQQIDPDALLKGALEKRFRESDRIADDRHYARLYRYLIGQGFEPDAVAALLRRYRS